MHELGLTRNIVAIVEEKASGRQVERIQLEIGRLAAVLPEAMKFCFDVCTQGTVAEGATLEIIHSEGAALMIRELELAPRQT